MENKENVTIIDIDNTLLDIEVLAEKVQVMVNDVDQDYFNVDIEKTGEMWKIAPPFYTTAGNMVNRIRELRELLDSVGKGGIQV